MDQSGLNTCAARGLGDDRKNALARDCHRVGQKMRDKHNHTYRVLLLILAPKKHGWEFLVYIVNRAAFLSQRY